MKFKDLVELDENAEIIDLGIASIETEGALSYSVQDLSNDSSYVPEAR